jgi:membrane associated rhomboid family serine protease
MMLFVLTYGIIAFTVIFSFSCFKNEGRLFHYAFIPYRIRNEGEHFRFLSHAFIHADEMHLIFNMIGFYFFGVPLEKYLCLHYSLLTGKIIFILFYSSAIYAASLQQFFKNKDNHGYVSLGASGAVNAVVFAFILIYPNSQMGFLLLPFSIPAWIFGLFYLGISYYLSSRRGSNPFLDRIDHSAHFWGAIYGICFMAVLQPSLLKSFFDKIF